MNPDVLSRVDGPVAIVTLNRPEKHNCLRFETLDGLIAALAAAGQDRGVGAVVLTGAGDKAFCTGGDLAVLSKLDPAGAERWHQRMIDLALQIRRLAKPVIAAVNGVAVGGGNELHLFCDLTIASERARFGQAGVRVGSVPMWGGTQLLPALVGEKRAREIVYLCDLYTAEEARQMGLVNRVVPHGDLLAAAMEWGQRIAAMSPAGIRLAKRALNEAVADLQARLERGGELLTPLWTSAEGREGMQAFLERRPPDFARYR